MSDDLVKRLRDLAQAKHDDLSIGAEAAARIAELEAALATARREGMEEAAKIAADFETVAYQHGNLPYMDPHECAAQTSREIAASIRAAAKEGTP